MLRDSSHTILLRILVLLCLIGRFPQLFDLYRTTASQGLSCLTLLAPNAVALGSNVDQI